MDSPILRRSDAEPDIAGNTNDPARHGLPIPLTYLLPTGRVSRSRFPVILIAGRTYQNRVVTLCGSAESVPSNAVTYTYPTGVVACYPPRNVRFTSTHRNLFTIDWDTPQNGQQLGYVFSLDPSTAMLKYVNFAEYRTNPWTTTQYFSFGPNHTGDPAVPLRSPGDEMNFAIVHVCGGASDVAHGFSDIIAAEGTVSGSRGLTKDKYTKSTRLQDAINAEPMTVPFEKISELLTNWRAILLTDPILQPEYEHWSNQYEVSRWGGLTETR